MIEKMTQLSEKSRRRIRAVGIIAEYDPFHNGHAWQIAEARRKTRAEAVVVVMSGFFTQRGEPACLSPFDRAACALQGGADLVLLLPACWSLRSAEGFALSGMRLLRELDVEAVSFGAETEDLALLRRAAELQNLPQVREALREGLDLGLGWAEAMQRASERTDPDAAVLLRMPNCILGIAYLQAAQALDFHPAFEPVLRTVPHHGAAQDGAFASASALRDALLRGEDGLLSAAAPSATVQACVSARASGGLVSPDALDQAVLARLRTMKEAEYLALPDCSEGLESALQKAARKSVSVASLIDLVSGRRYPRARIRRLCMAALLGIRREDIPPLPDCAIALGVKQGMEALLDPKKPDFPILTRSRDYPSDAPWMQAETRAADLWALAAGRPAGLLYREPLIRL